MITCTQTKVTELYSRRAAVKTDFSSTVGRYHYEPTNLLWSYGSIILGTGLILVLGLWSFSQNETSHDNLASSFGAVFEVFNIMLQGMSCEANVVSRTSISPALVQSEMLLWIKTPSNGT